MTFPAVHTQISVKFPQSANCCSARPQRRKSVEAAVLLKSRVANLGIWARRFWVEQKNAATLWTVRVKTKEDLYILGILTYFLLRSFHYLFLCVTLGKATLPRSPRFPPSSSSSSSSSPPSTSSSALRGVSLSHCGLASAIKWKRFRLPGSHIMHIKTTKCNHFCLVASVTNQEVFNHPEAQVRPVCSDQCLEHITQLLSHCCVLCVAWHQK